MKLRNAVRLKVLRLRHWGLRKIYRMDISKSCLISFKTKLDKTFPQGIHIGDDTYLASGAIVFTHDFSRKIKKHTCIGKKCFIGANAIIMCGVRIGDQVVVGSGAIVTHDIPSNSIVAGNPARIIKSDIKTGRYGQLKGGFKS